MISGRRAAKATLCRRLGVSAQRYTYWAREGLLDDVDRQGCTERQAVELAVLVALSNRMSLQAIREWWDDVRQQLRGRVISGDWYVVVHVNEGRARLAFEAPEAIALAGDGALVRIVPIHNEIAKARIALAANVGTPRQHEPRRLKRSHRGN